MEIVFGILMGLFALYVLVMCFVNLGKSIHSLFNQSRWKENASPDPDAVIVDMNSQQVKYVKNGAKFKTTVTFSDGFTFTTHKTNRVNHFGSYTISVDRREVTQMAKDAHEKAVEKKLGKAKPAQAPAPQPAAKATAASHAEPVKNPVILPADPVEAFKPQKSVPAVDDSYPKTVPVNAPKASAQEESDLSAATQFAPAIDSYPKTVPVNQPKPAADDYPKTVPVNQPKPSVVITPAQEPKHEPKPETTRWVCPRCGLVHSKTLAVCFHCGTEQTRANKFV